MKAYILVGMVGSGKSSWARMQAGTDFNVIRIGVDDIRSMIKDKYTFDFQLEPLVDKMKLTMIKEIISAGKDVIIDDIHLTKDSREKLCAIIQGIESDIEIIYVWMQCDNEVALKRRLTNLRGATEFEWRQIMDKHVRMFDTPSIAENDYVSDMIKVANNE